MDNSKRRLSLEEHRVLTRGALRIFQFYSLRGTDVVTSYIALAVYLGQLEGRPFDISSLSTFVDLPRSTVTRKLKELNGRVPALKLEGRGRKIATFETSPEQQALAQEYFQGLETIFTETCQELESVRNPRK